MPYRIDRPRACNQPVPPDAVRRPSRSAFEKAVSQRVQIKSVALPGHIKQFTRHQPAGQISQSRADLQHAIAQVRTQYASHPTDVLRGSRQVVQQTAAVEGSYKSSTTQKYRMTPSAFTPSFQPIFLPSS